MLNLDANATYGTTPEVEAWLCHILKDGLLGLNPSSIHQGGQRAKALLEEAREQLRQAAGAGKEDRIVFTSGATEANNHAFSLLNLMAGDEVLISSIEHPCIRESAAQLERRGISIRKLSPRPDGSFHPSDLGNLLSAKTKLCSVMLANNESGQILPVAEMCAAVRAESKRQNREILFHSDCSQALGKIPFSFTDLGCDLISLSAHKCGALSGTGALILKDSVVPQALLVGGPQEARWRAGTENVLGIGAFGIAAASTSKDVVKRNQLMKQVRNLFEAEVSSRFSRIRILLGDMPRLPNTSNLYIPGVKAHDLVIGMDLLGAAISSGAACASGKPGPSETLLAYGLSPDMAASSVRISVRHDTPAADVSRAAAQMCALVERLSSRKAGNPDFFPKATI